MEYYHDQHIGIYKNSISNEWCNKVIEYFETNNLNTSLRPKTSNTGAVIRDTSIELDDANLIKEFTNSFQNCLNLYTYEYPHMTQPISLRDYKIQKTLPTQGFHPYHVEYGWTSESMMYRIGVYTVYLNDVTEGGETEFLYQLKRIPPQKGTICVFPAAYTHVHRGNTPFSGEKYIMTGWLNIPQNIIDESKLRGG